MDPATAQLTLAIISQVLTNGPKVVKQIADLFGDDDNDEMPTPEQIRALKITADSEDFFK